MSILITNQLWKDTVELRKEYQDQVQFHPHCPPSYRISRFGSVRRYAPSSLIVSTVPVRTFI